MQDKNEPEKGVEIINNEEGLMKENNKKVAPSYSARDLVSPEGMMKMYANEPETINLWRGIEEVSIGYVFGPSKTGKTIFCENLGISLACGRSEFFGDKLIGKPKRVLILGIEEHYKKRAKRMCNQNELLNIYEQKLLVENMRYAGKDFPNSLSDPKYWDEFKEEALKFKPNIIIIDSLSRLLKDDITNREVCQKLITKLRDFAYENGIAILLVHHTRKNGGNPITMDTMVGSSYLSQEADFSIGINRNELTGKRYVKDVFYRYAESKELVDVYEINDNGSWLVQQEEMEEYKIINGNNEDSKDNQQLIVEYLENKAKEVSNSCDACVDYDIKSSELKKEFVDSGVIKSRTFDYALKGLVKSGILLKSGSRGNYKYKLN